MAKKFLRFEVSQAKKLENQYFLNLRFPSGRHTTNFFYHLFVLFCGAIYMFELASFSFSRINGYLLLMNFKFHNIRFKEFILSSYDFRGLWGFATISSCLYGFLIEECCLDVTK